MSQRLQSLDAMRGLTVALMILVNNGVGHNQFHQLQHSQWNGLTLCDLVFPFFLFMVGVSVWLSRNRLTLKKILSRTVKLFLVGVLLHVWDMLLDGQWQFWHELRVWGVLQRIALCYCAAAFIVMKDTSVRQIIGLIVLALVAYTAILVWGNGYAQDASSLLCRADRTLFGEAHLYHKSPIDPEGLLSTLPSIAHTLIGVLMARAITTVASAETRISIAKKATLMLAAGLLLSLWLPLNKRIWSPSYVLVTCALATLLLVALIRLEKRGFNSPTLFTAFGMNAFFLYVLSEMLSPVMSHLGVNQITYEAMLSGGLDPRMASLVYALLFDGLIALAAWWLWKRQIFVKI